MDKDEKLVLKERMTAFDWLLFEVWCKGWQAGNNARSQPLDAPDGPGVSQFLTMRKMMSQEHA